MSLCASLIPSVASHTAVNGDLTVRILFLSLFVHSIQIELILKDMWEFLNGPEIINTEPKISRCYSKISFYSVYNKMVPPLKYYVALLI